MNKKGGAQLWGKRREGKTDQRTRKENEIKKEREAIAHGTISKCFSSLFL